MNKQKIAILTDSGTDVPKAYIEKYGIFVAPLMINYSYGSFKDGVEINAQSVYDGLEKEIPKTSLPTGDVILGIMDKIISDGYNSLFVITISSGLSGTYNMIRLLTKERPQLDTRLIDTKNIGIGAGMTVIYATELIENGLDIDSIDKELRLAAENTKVYFCLGTLEYLAKGGRIGKVTAVVGQLLGVKPIISCDDDGEYYTVQRVRGSEKALHSLIKLATDYAGKGYKYSLAIAHGGAPELLQTVKKQVMNLVEGAKVYIEGEVSPALGVHTGPKLIGIGIQLYQN